MKREFNCWPSWRQVCTLTTWKLPAEVTKHDDELTSEERQTLIQKVGRMTVVEKIKAALTGNLETRSLLIRDSNKIISRAVLQSPKISETEAESYAAAKNVSEEVLRLLSMNRRFMKSYVVLRALVNNPRDAHRRHPAPHPPDERTRPEGSCPQPQCSGCHPEHGHQSYQTKRRSQQAEALETLSALALHVPATWPAGPG